jgi:hypothetical protein
MLVYFSLSRPSQVGRPQYNCELTASIVQICPLILLHEQRGIHNIDKEIRFEGNGGKMVVHDSEGFEAGRSNEVDVVKNFIERRSKVEDINERLHLVWLVRSSFASPCRLPHFEPFRYCIEMNSRPIQHAEKEFFSTFSQGDTPQTISCF